MEAEESLKLKVSEKEQQISSMQRQIDELKRKAEQGSQQLQGEVLELELEATLRAHFPVDRIEPVGKGEFGGDVLQGVVSTGGQACGALLWETKRTKNWADGWLAKLRADQRAAGAEFAILVSNALPKEVDTFGYVGIWVTDFRFVVPLAVALRQSLVEIASKTGPPATCSISRRRRRSATRATAARPSQGTRLRFLMCSAMQNVVLWFGTEIWAFTGA